MNERAKYLAEGAPSRDPAPITDVLGVVMENASARYGASLVRLRARWTGLAGATWSGTTPVAIHDGVVLVEVADGARASLLRFETDALLDAIEAEFGEGFARGIRLRVARPPKR